MNTSVKRVDRKKRCFFFYVFHTIAALFITISDLIFISQFLLFQLPHDKNNIALTSHVKFQFPQ
jgi:hypothetical protein